MGIRVHKAVGYGVRGPVLDQYSIDKFSNTPVASFIKWCEQPKVKERLDAMVPLSDKFRHGMFRVDTINWKEKSGTMSGHILYDGEYGLKDALLFIPMGYREEWSRYDSAIDFVEETRFHNQECRYEPIAGDLYPFDRKRPPLTVAAMCLFLKMPELFDRLEEALYVYWS